MKINILIAFYFSSIMVNGQAFTSYLTGDTADVQTSSQFGLCLMGGATDNDNAMKWFLQKSGGGDIVVLRATGTNGYNNYFYSQLGILVNSVETIKFNNAAAAFDPYVLRRIAGAEAVFIAGGDQSVYMQYWKGTPVDSLLNALSAKKKIPIGGTSAGMAILGGCYYSAQTGSVTSAQALANPFSSLVTVGKDNFLKLPFMRNTITDTHYDNPDRRGRHVVFMSRLLSFAGDSIKGIACDEYTAVCIDSSGIAKVFGGSPNFDDNAYFLQVNPQLPNTPETLVNGQPLTWDRNHAALKVYRVKGTPQAINSFNLNNWYQASGGDWQHWYVINGTLFTTPGSPPGGVLPLYFTYFSVEQTSSEPKLIWKIGSNMTISRFVVERAIENKSFVQIAEVNSQPALTSYFFRDRDMLSSILHYRIKAVFANGDVTYSKVVTLKDQNRKGLITIFSNPIKYGTLRFKIWGCDYKNPVFYQIHDYAGRLFLSGQLSKGSSGIQKIDLPTYCSPGIYFFTAEEQGLGIRYNSFFIIGK